MNKDKKYKTTVVAYNHYHDGEQTLKVQEHQLVLEANPYRMKLIAESIRSYMDKYNLADDTTLSDFCFNMETSYQSFHNLHEDNWDFTEYDSFLVKGGAD
jgi:hypothetical protein